MGIIGTSDANTLENAIAQINPEYHSYGRR